MRQKFNIVSQKAIVYLFELRAGITKQTSDFLVRTGRSLLKLLKNDYERVDEYFLKNLFAVQGIFTRRETLLELQRFLIVGWVLLNLSHFLTSFQIYDEPALAVSFLATCCNVEFNY